MNKQFFNFLSYLTYYVFDLETPAYTYFNFIQSRNVKQNINIGFLFSSFKEP